MSTTVGVWTLVLGGWVLPPPEPPTGRPNVPAYEQPGAGSNYSLRGLTGRSAQRRSSFGQPAAPGRQASGEEAPMPFAPTDTMAAAGTYPLGLPTENLPLMLPNTARQPTAGRPSQRYSGYRYRPHGAAGSYAQRSAQRQSGRGYSAFFARQMQGTSLDVRQRTNYGRTVSPARKPFAGYQQTPPVSPYMDLFRTDTDLGTVDNYYTMVKPRIDQRNSNLHVGGQIRGLQGTSQRQGTALRNLGRDARSLRGVSSSGYHMNLGTYYPGFQR